MKIGFRLDAGGEVGLGHFFRCLSLAEAFLGLGNEVYFLSRNLPDWLQEIARERGSGVYQISSFGPYVRLSSDGGPWNRLSLSDASETIVVSNSLGLDLIVVDHYGIDQAWITSVEEKGPKLLQLADFPAFKGGDFLLDYGFDASLAKHKMSEFPRQGLLLGSKFAPVSRVSSNPDELVIPETSGSAPLVSIALGSAVSVSFLESVEFEYLSSARNFSLAIVAEKKSRDLSGANGVHWVAPSDGLGGLFSGSVLAVTSGGVSMYERIAYGVPGLVVETAANQRFALQAIRGCGLGDDTFTELQDLNPRSLLEIISRKVRSGNDSTHSLLLKSTIDFFGPLRVAFGVGALPLSSDLVARRFEPKDAPILLNWANDPVVRFNSISASKISPEEHILWQEKFPSNGTQIWIFDYQGIPFGQVRFELENCRTFVSYSVDSLFRGLRLSKEMLSIAIHKALIREDIFAKARPTNTASIKILTALGFLVSSSRDDLITFVLPQGLNT
jgi:spore coat polysaccharide biosynthesis predicted glycosyltransferase SpsG/RimJ/RimL family protein N-acetyltransferase